MLARIAGILAIAAAVFFLLTYDPPPRAPVIAPVEAVVPPPPPLPAPEFTWTQVESRTFATYAGYFTPIPLPPRDQSKMRVRVTAEQPVIFGFAADEEQFRSFLEGNTGLCASSNVMDVAQDCRPEPGATLFVADSRRAGRLQVATLEALLREGERLARARQPNKIRQGGVIPNRVTVAVMEWRCVANCPPPATPGRKTDRR